MSFPYMHILEGPGSFSDNVTENVFVIFAPAKVVSCIAVLNTLLVLTFKK